MDVPIEPSDKSEAMEDVIGELTSKDRKEVIRKGLCMTCSGKAYPFRDETSRKEYAISGMCQGCQDETFNVNDDYPEYLEEEGEDL